MNIALFQPLFILRQMLNNFCGIVAIFFFSSFLKWREPYKSRKLAVHLVSFFVTLILGLIRGVPALSNTWILYHSNMLLYFAFQIALLIKCFEGSVGYKLFIFLINKLIECILITIGYTFLGQHFPELSTLTQGNPTVWDVVLSYTVINLLDILFSLIFVVFFKAAQKLRNRLPIQLLFLLIPLSQFLLLFTDLAYAVAIMDIYTMNKFIVWAFIGIFIGCIGDTLLFITIRRLRITAELEAQVKINGIQQQYYDMLEQQQQQIREMQHDINNHLATIKSLADASGDSDEARYYSEHLNKTYSLTRLDYCGNRVVNALLVNKASACARAGIKAEFEVSLGASSFVGDVDLVSLISNLLDNAAEAAALSDDAFIRFCASDKNGVLSLLCENSVSGAKIERACRDGKLSRGNGLKIIKRIAERYGGRLKKTQDGSVFTLSLTLYDPGDAPAARHERQSAQLRMPLL